MQQSDMLPMSYVSPYRHEGVVKKTSAVSISGVLLL